ncbi:MAG: hypothetical protein ACPGU1_23210 [Myxococcota bacterium]
MLGRKYVLGPFIGLATLALAPTGWGFSDGAPPDPPTWMVPAVEEPLTIPQEGVVVLQASRYNPSGFYDVEPPVYALTVTDAAGGEVAGEASYVVGEDYQPSALIWRASSGELVPGEAYSIHLELTQHSASSEPAYEAEIDLVVSETETPELLAASVVSHRTDISHIPLWGYTCFAPNMALQYSPSADFPEWMHRTLSYELGQVMTTGELLATQTHNNFKVSKVYESYIHSPEQLTDTYCVSLTTKSAIDDSSVTEEHCLTEQDFLDALEDGQALCTLENLSEHLADAAANDPDYTVDDANHYGGCHGAPQSALPWLLALLALFALWLRAARPPVYADSTRR